MEEISNASARIAAGDLSVRVTPGSRDEAGELARAFNSMAEAIETAFRERDRAAEAHKTLIASISHDLRTPLASLQAMVEALEDGIVEEPEVEECYLIQMRRQIDDLAAMIEDLFALSRLEAGDLELACEPVDVADLVSDTVEEFRVRADRQAVTIEARGGGPAVVSGNAVALQRVLRNLVDNALAHTPPGGTVSLEVGRENGEICVEVRDTGLGFEPRFLDRAFDAFARGDPSRNRSTGGAGLGLAIARHLTLAHGGTVHAENRSASTGNGLEEHRGARLTVRLPAIDSGTVFS